MRASLGVVFFAVVFASGGGAVAQEAVAVLPADLGGGPVTTADLAAALLHEGVPLAPPRRTAEGIQARYVRPAGVDHAQIAALAEQGETAYFEMQYDAAVQALSTPEWSAAERAVADIGAEPELAEALIRGLMARARAQFFSNRAEAADGTLRSLARLFPAWRPSTDEYEPEIVDQYAAVREAALQAGRTLTVQTPAESCTVAVNGLGVGQGSQVSVPVVDGDYAVTATCDSQRSRVHLVQVPATASVVVDPSFDQRFDPSSVSLAPAGDAADDLSRLTAWGRAFADVSRTGRVILAGVTAADELQLVLVDSAAGSMVAVRCERVEGTHPIESAMSALLGGEAGPNVTVARGGSWEAEGGDGGGGSIAPWVAFGVGGAGLIMGVVFLLVEDGAYSDYEACRADPSCATTGDLSSLQSDAETAGVLSTIGFGIAAAGAITGAILLVLEGGDETAEASAEPVGWVPQIAPQVSPSAAGVELGWRF